mgnify:FL=1
MDPMTLQMLLAGAKTAASVAPMIIPTSEQSLAKKELDELRRRQELGALGFTPEEMSADIEGQIAASVQLRAQQKADAAMARGVAVSTGSGQALEDARSQEEAQQEQQRQAFNSALQRSEADKVREEQRIDVLAAGADAAQQAAIEGVATGAATILGGVSETMDMKRKIEGAAMTPEDLTAFSKKVGLPEPMAKQLMRDMATNPDMMTKFMAYLTAVSDTEDK